MDSVRAAVLSPLCLHASSRQAADADTRAHAFAVVPLPLPRVRARPVAMPCPNTVAGQWPSRGPPARSGSAAAAHWNAEPDSPPHRTSSGALLWSGPSGPRYMQSPPPTVHQRVYVPGRRNNGSQRQLQQQESELRGAAEAAQPAERPLGRRVSTNTNTNTVGGSSNGELGLPVSTKPQLFALQIADRRHSGCEDRAYDSSDDDDDDGPRTHPRNGLDLLLPRRLRSRPLLCLQRLLPAGLARSLPGQYRSALRRTMHAAVWLAHTMAAQKTVVPAPTAAAGWVPFRVNNLRLPAPLACPVLPSPRHRPRLRTPPPMLF